MLEDSLSKDPKAFSFANQMDEQKELFESLNQYLKMETSLDKKKKHNS